MIKLSLQVESRPVDVEYVRLLHDIHSEDISGHLYRGYTVLPSHGLAKTKIREIENFIGNKRPVWFVFSGMGSQWPGMGKSLILTTLAMIELQFFIFLFAHNL